MLKQMLSIVMSKTTIKDWEGNLKNLNGFSTQVSYSVLTFLLYFKLAKARNYRWCVMAKHERPCQILIGNGRKGLEPV